MTFEVIVRDLWLHWDVCNVNEVFVFQIGGSSSSSWKGSDQAAPIPWGWWYIWRLFYWRTAARPRTVPQQVSHKFLQIPCISVHQKHSSLVLPWTNWAGKNNSNKSPQISQIRTELTQNFTINIFSKLSILCDSSLKICLSKLNLHCIPGVHFISSCLSWQSNSWLELLVPCCTV